MEFVPVTGLCDGDLRVVAECLAGTHDNIQDHINSLGVEIDCASTLLDDLEAGGYIASCDECGIWERPANMDVDLCMHCADELEQELEDDEMDDFGFDEDLFDDEDDILEECIEDSIFDETDDEEDL